MIIQVKIFLLLVWSWSEVKILQINNINEQLSMIFWLYPNFDWYTYNKVKKELDFQYYMILLYIIKILDNFFFI